jgi:hypothetical protein
MFKTWKLHRFKSPQKVLTTENIPGNDLRWFHNDFGFNFLEFRCDEFGDSCDVRGHVSLHDRSSFTRVFERNTKQSGDHVLFLADQVTSCEWHFTFDILGVECATCETVELC